MEVINGFKQTDVGIIPEDWEVKTAAEICLKIQDGTHFSPTSRGEDYLYITSKNIGYGYLDISSAERIDTLQHKSIYKRCDVKKGDLLLTKDGANTGNAALNNLDEEISLLSSVAFLHFDHRQHFPGYYLQQILSTGGQNRIKALMAGNAITRLTLEKIRKLYFAVPSLPEQRAIAAALSDGDALLAALDDLIAKKRLIKQGAMQELLTGKRRLMGFEEKLGYKQTEVGLIPDDWRVSTLGELCAFENGDRGKNYPSGAYVSSGVPFVNAGHLAEGSIRISELNYISKENYDLLGSGKFLPGDILFCLRGSLGKFGVVGQDIGEGAIASSLVIVRSKSANLDSDYLVCYFRSAYCAQMIDKWSGGAAQPNLGVQDLVRFIIAIPPTKPEQTAIAEILSDMDAEIAALEARREKTRLLKQGMMQELLTGRIRLI